MSTEPDMDPLLAELIAGEVRWGDPRVKNALRDDPKREHEWRTLAAIGDDLAAEGAALREAIESRPSGLDEDALLEAFRGIAGKSPAGSHSTAKPGTARASARGDNRSTSRRLWGRRLVAASIALLGVMFVIRGTHKAPVEPDPSRYLGTDTELFVTSTDIRFGTARWSRSDATAFDLEVRASTDGVPYGPSLVSQVQLDVDTWSIDPTRLLENVTELHWTLTVFNEDGLAAKRDIWVQRRP